MIGGRAPARTNKTLQSTVATNLSNAAHYVRGSDLTNNAASKVFLLSFWLRIDSDDRQQILTTTNLKLQITKSNFGRFAILAKDAGGNAMVNIQSKKDNLLSKNGWMHLAACWDSSVPGSQGIFLNGERLPATLNNTVVQDSDIDFPDTDYRISAYTNGTIPLNGCLSQFYMNTMEYRDLSVEANMRMFIDENSRPVFLGYDGSLPTGSKPIIFAPSGDFSANMGYGGSFTAVNSPSQCSDSP